MRDVLLFDLGGVVVPWVGLEALAEREHTSRQAIVEKFEALDVFNAYEIGECENDDFLASFVDLFDLNIPLGEAAQLWNSWVLPPFAGVIDAIEQLKENYIVACLSNTNDLHWQHLNGLFKTAELFDFDFASHQIKAAKPDPRSYEIPLEKMGVEASRVTFFDDTLINVEAARKLGMTAHQVDRSVGVFPTLKHLGYLEA
jgi:putative hydrolase of the HAD superfamily